MRRLDLVVLSAVLLAGCASADRRGERALHSGDYNEAIHLFQATLAEHPDRLDARVGLGVALYKAGALADAAVTLDDVLAREPTETSALLTRGLIAIQQGEDAVAADHLTRFDEAAHIPRLAGQLGAALRILRGAEPLSADMRQFMAASLEAAVRSARDVEQARLAAQRASFGAFPLVRCTPTRHGWLCF